MVKYEHMNSVLKLQHGLHIMSAISAVHLVVIRNSISYGIVV